MWAVHEPGSTDLAQVLGFLVEGELGNELLTFDPGVSVLYGLNGAGKSRILSDIQFFSAGVAGVPVNEDRDLLALIRLPQPETTTRTYWGQHRGNADWYEDWARMARVREGSHEAVLRAWFLDHVLDVADDDIAVPGGLPAGERREGLCQEWLTDPLILVKASGFGGEANWISAPALVTGNGRRFVNEEVALYDQMQATHLQHEDTPELAIVPVGRTLDGATIVCCSSNGTTSLLSSFGATSGAFHHEALLDVSPRLGFETALDADEETRARLARVFPAIQDPWDLSPGDLDPFIAAVRALEARANHHFAKVLQDPPRLRLHVSVVGLDKGCEWFVDQDDTPLNGPSYKKTGSLSVDEPQRQRKISDLSTAQRKWTLWSIRLALQTLREQSNLPSSDTLLLIDEPEAALHRSAEAHMASYLADLTADGSTRLLVATHSPELLDLPAARVFEVTRSRGLRKVSSLSPPTRDNMTSLGLNPSDLLRRQRGFVLVEGEHDELLLKTLFEDELRSLRVEVLPLRGAHQLTPAKIGFLFDYTPAHIFIMLDNIDWKDMYETWERALAWYKDGNLTDALEMSGSRDLQEDDRGQGHEGGHPARP